MSRRFQELEERGRHDVDSAKAVLKRLGDRERLYVIAWLCKYYGDSGARLPAEPGRRRIALDGVEFWLVRVPRR
jgi:hypothetical protein